MTIRCGVGLITCQRAPGETRSDVELYADALAFAEEAERLGFASVWVSEHHFVDDGYLPSLLPMCAAIAARTARVEIGTALLLAPLYEPLRLAEDAAVVDLISGGRLILGLGLGWREEEFDALSIPLRDRVRRLEEAVAVCRTAWAGERVGGGRPDVVVTPRPARPGGPPIWIGGLSEAAARRAARIADGFMATEVTPASLAEQVSWVSEEAGRAASVLPSRTISMHVPTYVHDGDPDAGWAEVLPAHHYVGWKYEDMEGARSRSAGSPAPPPVAPNEETELREGIVFGDAVDVAATIRSFADAAGGDLHFIARLYWPGLPPDRLAALLQRFSTDVLPLLV
jgi:alkanesulfonate monooxygenase SsuD/methylene tetrahydromethanopterin reductase-like flavin-dependent oxidoreductase (luciferase family)